MRTKQVLFFLVMGLGCQNLIAQCLQVSPSLATTTPNDAYTFSVSGMPTFPGTMPAPDTPFYWVFRIFGNGEYFPKMERTWPAPSTNPAKHCWENYSTKYSAKYTPTFQQDYAYPTAGTFNPILIALPRKGDPPPPAAPYAYKPSYMPVPSPICSLQNFTVVASGSPTPPVIHLPVNSGRRIHLTHSHGYLNYQGERGVFVLSYKPDADCPSGSVHLYYGSINNNHQRPLGASPSAHLKASQSYNPKYGTIQTPAFLTNTPNLLPLRFLKHDVFPFTPVYINAVGGVPGFSGEFRLFQEAEFEDPLRLLGPSDWSYALAVLTSTDTCGNWVHHDLLYQDLGLSDNIGAVPHLGSEYVVDVDTIYLKSGPPVDPNRLVITEIRPCCGSAQIKVSLELTFCNTGMNRADTSIIHLNALNPNGIPFHFCQSPQTTRPGTSLDWDGCSNTLQMTGAPLYPGECAQVTFSLVTSAQDLGVITSILQRIPVAGGDVRLLPSPEVVGFVNEMKESLPVIEDCGECACDPARICIPPWGYVLITVALLAALWAFAPKVFRLTRRTK